MSDERCLIMMNPETGRLERFPSEVVALKLAARHGVPGAAARLRLVRAENRLLFLSSALVVLCAAWVVIAALNLLGVLHIL